MIGINKRSANGLLVALLLSLLAGWPLLVGPGIINTRAGGDSPFLLVRLQQLITNLTSGVFPARWMPDAAYGLGYPFFNYYAHLPYYFAAFIKLWGVGYIWAIRLTQIFGLLGAAAFMYLYLRKLRLGEAAATLGAMAYTFAPFHLVNLYVRGDSLSEFYAFLFYPLLLWSVERIKENPLFSRAALLSLAYGGLIFTHNISALIFTPFLVLYILAVAIRLGDKRGPFLLKCAFGLTLGLVLSAFYWVPAFLEKGYVHIAEATAGYFNYANHFRDADIVQPTIIFDFAIKPLKKVYSMGLVQALTTLGAAIFLAGKWVRSKAVDLPAAIHLVFLGASTFMITSLSQPLWDQLSLLQFVQFPWRFLSIQALTASGLIALAIERVRWPGSGSIILGALLVGSSFFGLHPEYLDVAESDITPERLRIYEYFTTNIGSTVRGEYLPAGVETRPFTSPYLTSEENPPPVALEGGLLSSRLLWQRPDSQEWEIEVETPASRLAFPLYWFAGWQGYVDGNPVETRAGAGLGYLELTLDGGEHSVVLRLERTPLRLGSEILSLLGLVIVAILFLRGVPLPWRKIGIFTAVIVASGVLLNFWSRPTISGAAGLSDLSMDFGRMPYLHHNPQGIRFGEELRLVGYQYSAAKVRGGEDVSIILYWKSEHDEQLETEVSLVSPAVELFGARDGVAISRLPIAGENTRHQLPVSPRALSGLYLVRVRVFGLDRQFGPVNERGEELGTIYLEPVWIFNPRPAPEDQPVLAVFGDSIRLVEMRAESLSPARIQVDLEWMATRPIPRNYALSFRFRGASGEVLFARDLQPHYGFFPTSLWPAEELVSDSYIFRIPPRFGGEVEAIEIVMYQVQDLAPLGNYLLVGIGE